MQQDSLPIALTKPTLHWGVPLNLLIGSFVGCLIPALMLYSGLFAKSAYGFVVLLGTWLISFYLVYKLALYLTRKDVHFMRLYSIWLNYFQASPNRKFWGGVNGYSPG